MDDIAIMCQCEMKTGGTGDTKSNAINESL